MVAADGVPSVEVIKAAVDKVPTCRDLIVIDDENPLSELTADGPGTVTSPPGHARDAAVITFPHRDLGTPKGVVLSHAAMLHNAAAVTAMLYDESSDQRHPDVHLVVVPLFHVVALEGFGHSETGMVGLHARVGDAKPQSVGSPAPGTQVRLVTSDGTEVVGPGEGELWIRGPGLMSGYLHDAQASAAVLRDGWHHTGNTAHREVDGHFVMVGRPTHVVMRGGHVIYRRALEEALLTHPAISAAKSVAMPDARLGEEL